MTITTGPQIGVSDINQEVFGTSVHSSDLNFLNNLITPGVAGQGGDAGGSGTGTTNQRPGNPNMAAFYGLSYYKNTKQGNCDAGQCVPANCNCNCGNCATGSQYTSPADCNCGTGDQSQNCHVCANCSAINCANCDPQAYLQSGTNCACTYNCYASQCYGQACACSKIICTKLHEIGLMQKNIFDADQLYGEYLRKNDPKVYDGYIRWASIIVDGMTGTGPDFMFWVDKDIRKQKERELVIKWAHKVATPWSEHMAYLMQVVKKDNDVGRVLMKVGRFVSRLVSYLPKSKKPAKLPTIAFTWIVFTSTYYLSSLYVKLSNKINLFTKVKLQ